MAVLDFVYVLIRKAGKLPQRNSIVSIDVTINLNGICDQTLKKLLWRKILIAFHKVLKNIRCNLKVPFVAFEQAHAYV